MEDKLFLLPELKYGYCDLEPFISKEIMELHHLKHHKTYITNLNNAVVDLEEAINNKNISAIISIEASIKFNGGGHLNHSLFWKMLAPVSKGGGNIIEGAVQHKIIDQWKSIENFQEIFNKKAVSIQGSGWCWLGLCKITKQLSIVTTMNQDPLEATLGLIPILGVDVWEHAYYLQYKNVRAEYVSALWNIINWAFIEENAKAIIGH